MDLLFSKISSIIFRYERVLEYREERAKLVARLVMTLVQMVSALTAFIVMSFFDWDDFVLRFLAVTVLFFASFFSNEATRLFRDVNQPNRYKESVIKELSKLGYTLEEAQELMNQQVSSK